MPGPGRRHAAQAARRDSGRCSGHRTASCWPIRHAGIDARRCARRCRRATARRARCSSSARADDTFTGRHGRGTASIIYFIYTYDTWHVEPSEIYRVPVKGGARRAGRANRSPSGVSGPAAVGRSDLLRKSELARSRALVAASRTATTRLPLTNGVGEHIENAIVSGWPAAVISTLLTMRAGAGRRLPRERRLAGRQRT